MTGSYLLANLKLGERNREWFRSDLPLSTKMQYYPSMAASYLRMATGGASVVNYLGHPFFFDNPATPLNLQTYPFELTTKAGMLGTAPATVLDLGANIGQFSRTAAHLWPEATIDSFEPNPAAFELLCKNTEHLPNISRFNVAIGAKGSLDFYFEPGRSGTGSFLRENVGALNTIETIQVDVADDPTVLTGRSDYDLVKLDVEGYEYEVLDRLRNVRCRTLFLEGSLGRSKTYRHDELFTRIADVLEPYEIVASTEVRAGMATFEMALNYS